MCKRRAASVAALVMPAAGTGLATPTVEQRSAIEFSRSRLDRIDDFFDHEVAAGKIPGAIVSMQRHGQPVYFQAFGVREVATGAPMTADTIFRLYSMSKPITAVAAMTLVEEGKLSLSAPLSKYIPAFADVKVGGESTGADGKPRLDLVPFERPIIIQDLLRHSSGLVYDYVRGSASASALRCEPSRESASGPVPLVRRIGAGRPAPISGSIGRRTCWSC